MPLRLCSAAGLLQPRDAIPGLSRSGGNSAKHQRGSCLAFCRDSKLATIEKVVDRLAGDVDLLLMKSCAAGDSEHAPLKAIRPQVIEQVSDDVQIQLHYVLHAICEVTADRAGKAQYQEHRYAEMLENFVALDLPVQLLIDLPLLQFEARKDVMNICCALLWPGLPKHINRQVLQYLESHPCVFQVLVAGYANEETALHYGIVLRSYARHAELVEAFLKSGLALELLRHTQSPSIDISSDAFFTLRQMLLEHKSASARWLDNNFQEFFTLFNSMLASGDYLFQRQALKLLASLFTHRSFKRVTLAYVTNEQHLKLTMNFLRSTSKVLRFDAFQVFKFFAGNPQKPQRVRAILSKNKKPLLEVLEALQAPKEAAEHFASDRRTVVHKLLALDPPGLQAAALTHAGAPALLGEATFGLRV